MDPFRLALAVIPLAVYLATLGLLSMRGRPFVTTGARDIGALGIGIVGLVMVGPLELFLPEGPAIHFGGWVWLLLVVFYGLCISLIVLLLRPRLVIYNISMDQLRPLLTEIAKTMDSKSRWTSDSMIIPNRTIHFHLESVDWLNNVQIISTGNRQSFEGWRELELRLREATRTIQIVPNAWSIGLLTASGLLALMTASSLFFNPTEVAQNFRDFFRL